MKMPIALLLFVLSIGCTTSQEQLQEYSHKVGDIVYEPTIDMSTFKLCDSTNVYHSRGSMSYDRGFQTFKEDALAMYQYKPQYKAFSGFIVVRFTMNCEGEMGRFRTQTLDYDFSLKPCPPSLENHITQIVKGLDGWDHSRPKYKSLDCSKFLNFKFNNGQIEDIIP